MEPKGRIYLCYPDQGATLTLYASGDWHLGNAGCDKKALRRDLAAIASDPYSFALGTGDYADFISLRDRRFDAETLDPEIVGVRDLVQLGAALMTAVRDHWQPIAEAGRLLGLAFGNHEKKYLLETDQMQLHRLLCEELGAANFGYSALFWLIFRRCPRIKAPRIVRPGEELPKGENTLADMVFVHHGAGAAATKGGKTNRVVQLTELTMAGFVFTGHLHDLLSTAMPKMTLDPSGQHLLERSRVGVMTGSYLRTYADGQTGYGEMKGYPMAAFGSSCLRVTPDTGEVFSLQRVAGCRPYEARMPAEVRMGEAA